MSTYLGDLLAIATALVWSLAVIFFRWGSDRIGVLPLKVFHNLFATVLLFGCLPLFSQPWLPSLSLREWSLVAISAVLGITIGDTLYVAAIQRIGAGGQALVDCLYAPTIVVLAFFMFGEYFSVLGWIGSALILIAVFIAHNKKIESKLTSSLATDLKRHRTGLFYGVLSQLAMALCIVLIRDILRSDSIAAITAYRYVIGTACLVAVALPRYSVKYIFSGLSFKEWNRYSIVGSFLGPFLATLLWFASFKYTTAGRAAVYNQLSTIFIIILARLFLKEPLNTYKILALILASIGGYLVGIS